ncbi:Hypothetical predicted protein, partial [Pelobates cultripes]
MRRGCRAPGLSDRLCRVLCVSGNVSPSCAELPPNTHTHSEKLPVRSQPPPLLLFGWITPELAAR